MLLSRTFAGAALRHSLAQMRYQAWFLTPSSAFSTSDLESLEASYRRDTKEKRRASALPRDQHRFGALWKRFISSHVRHGDTEICRTRVERKAGCETTRIPIYHTFCLWFGASEGGSCTGRARCLDSVRILGARRVAGVAEKKEQDSCDFGRTKIRSQLGLLTLLGTCAVPEVGYLIELVERGHQ